MRAGGGTCQHGWEDARGPPASARHRCGRRGIAAGAAPPLSAGEGPRDGDGEEKATAGAGAGHVCVARKEEVLERHAQRAPNAEDNCEVRAVED